MTYTPQATSRFNRVKKKLPEPLRLEIDRQVDVLCEDPSLGQQKRGDLQGVWVWKFKFHAHLYLLAYLTDEKSKTITLLAIGGHENFYRDLKRYVQR